MRRPTTTSVNYVDPKVGDESYWDGYLEPGEFYEIPVRSGRELIDAHLMPAEVVNCISDRWLEEGIAWFVPGASRLHIEFFVANLQSCREEHGF